MTDISTVIEGSVKFRDGKKWKSRWCVMRKLSPVADCLHLQLYRDSKDRYKQSQTKASLSLQNFLGVHSGFTLDKESNTLAILCQDVSVVLAFDTRERLIQWQVKIANNLGEDEQFLVQICSAPAKAKVSPGPARLHIQEFRFCLTVGVPPRLVGNWQIQQLRKYGSVEKKFCFEGGSTCGKGEGLYVLVTDQGENITRAFQMAAEGRLSVRRRPLARNMSVMTSPRRSIHSRMDPRVSDLSCVNSVCPRSAESDAGDTRSQLGWSAADLHCDASSVIEDRDSRSCSSRATRLLSRSSTLTASPHQTTDYYDGCFKNGTLSMASNYDRSTVSSLEYWSCQSSSPPSVGGRVRSWSAVPGRPLPLRAHNSVSSSSVCGCKQSPYSNYDVPKPISGRSSVELPKENVKDSKKANYDIPRCIRDSAKATFCSRAKDSQRCYSPTHQQVQKCLVVEREESRPLKCPCQRVMCWAGSWIRLPHLLTGAFRTSITDTTAIHKVKLDGEGKMPFVNCRRESQISCARSRQPSLSEVLDEEQELCRTRPETQETDIQYANVKVVFNSCTEKTDTVIQEEPKPANPYVNLEFSNSLKLYENSRDLMQNCVLSTTSNLNEILTISESKKKKCCEKCFCKITVPKSISKNDDYLFMEPALNCSQRKSSLPVQQSSLHEKFSQGYLPMTPVSCKLSNTDSTRKIYNKRSQSTPTLPIAPQKTSERLKQKNKIVYHSISENSSPSRCCIRTSVASIDLEISSSRKRSNSIDSSKFLESLESIKDKVASPTISNTNSTDALFNLPPKPKPVVVSSSEHGLSRVTAIHEFETKSEFKILNDSTNDQHGNERLFETDAVNHSSGKIKRSASIPCKYVYNRDSSSSNDSGVSSGSLKFRKRDGEFDFRNFSKTRSSLKLQKCHKSKREYFNKRKSKSFDVLEENTLVQVNKTKSSSAEALIRNFSSKEYPALPKVTYLDSQSSSSGTSDMSDYIETLSLYSYTSSDTPDSYQLHLSNNLRP